VRLPSLSETLPDRWRDSRLPAYPWWIPVLFNGAAFAAVAAGAAQRLGSDAFWPVAGLAVITLTPWIADFVGGGKVRYIQYGVLSMAASSVAVVRYPVDYDLLPVVWTVLAGCLGATERYWRGKVAALACVAVVIILAVTVGLDGAVLWVCVMVLGWDIGVVMQFQQRRLDEQAANESVRREQALLAERQRIAREVHDVVAHSLSVTMLHLTAARRDLEVDGAEGIEDALSALRDAEIQGREAMTDIRHTVGLLGQGSGVTRPAPGATDVPALVEEFRTAGLDVVLDLRGDPASVPVTAGLSVYRIVQESLANVAKHQPGARAGVVLDLAAERQAVQVWNTLSSPVRASHGGSGLHGMRTRSEQLDGTFRAGPREGTWVVEAAFPAEPGKACLLNLARSLRPAGSAPDPATGSAGA